jgi:hypothetical protein
VRVPLSILLTIQIENSGACAWPTVISRLRKSPQLEAMLTPGEVAAMPRVPNSAVPMTRAMSLGPGRAILTDRGHDKGDAQSGCTLLTNSVGSG